MAKIVELFPGIMITETVEVFVRREGPVTTSAVGYRFGWETRDARAALLALERAGKVARAPRLRMDISHGRGGGAVRQLVWLAP